MNYLFKTIIMGKLNDEPINVMDNELSIETIEKIDIQNLFLYLKQEVASPAGFIDKSKALTNVLIKEDIFNFFIKSNINKKNDDGISMGSDSIEGFAYTSIYTTSNKEEHYSIFAKQINLDKMKTQGPGVVTGFLLRKEKTFKKIKNILEARLILNNGKECTLKYDYTLAN